ncbi:MAG: hypothetical protein OXI72_09265, partial [Gemmatimonadota bacterium]|nr:hypothetical protein [Gemmatimonadota bacterium]
GASMPKMSGFARGCSSFRSRTSNRRPAARSFSAQGIPKVQSGGSAGRGYLLQKAGGDRGGAAPQLSTYRGASISAGISARGCRADKGAGWPLSQRDRAG